MKNNLVESRPVMIDLCALDHNYSMIMTFDGDV